MRISSRSSLPSQSELFSSCPTGNESPESLRAFIHNHPPPQAARKGSQHRRQRQSVLSIAGLVDREAMQSLRAISPRATEEKLKQPMSTTAVDYYESTVFSERCQIPKSLTICFNSYLRF